MKRRLSDLKWVERLSMACLGVFALRAAAGEPMTLSEVVAAMQAGAANPVETAAGTWSIYNTRNEMYLTPSAVEGEDGVFLPRVSKAETLPRFVANTNETSVVWSGNTIPAGLSYWHPDYNGTDDIVFRPKANGAYTMTLYMRDLAGGAPADQGPGVSGAIYVNDEKVGEIEVALESAIDLPAEDRVTVEHVFLTVGDTVKVSLGSRGNNWDDATIVEFKMAREDAWAASFTERLSAMVPDAETIVNPMTVAGEGTWSVFWRWGTENEGKLMDQVAFDSAGATRGLLGSTDNGYPFIVANCTTACATYRGTSVPSGSVYFHPNNTASHTTVIRFAPQDSATYSIVADITDTGNWIGTGDAGGVNIAAWTLGARMDGNARVCETNVWVCKEKDVPTGRLELLNRQLAQGQSVEIRLDNNGRYDSDATLIRLRVWQVAGSRVKDRRVEGLHDFSLAYVAALKAAEPSPTFQDTAGGTWQVGWTLGADGALNPNVSPISAKDDAWKGWINSTAAQPYVYANVSDVAQASPGNYGSYLPGECVLHPIGGTGEAYRYAAIRFTAPADGLYTASVRAAITGSVPASPRENDDGVELFFRGSCGGYAASGLSKHEVGCQVVDLLAEGLWLKAGETLTFQGGPNKFYWYDETAFSGLTVQKTEDLSGVDYLQVNLSTASDQSYSGAGRVGFSTDVWPSVAVGSHGVRYVRKFCRANGTRTNVGLVATRRGGTGTFATFAGAANGLLAGGITSADAADIWDLVLTGLQPNGRYSLYLYSRTGTAGENGVFAFGGEPTVANAIWLCKDGGDYARVEVVADEKGVVRGTFAGQGETAAAFNALQIVGARDAFPDYEQAGVVVIFK